MSATARSLHLVLELAAQQRERIPPETLRTFASSDRDGTARAQAVELLADQAGGDPATLALLRSLASKDVSATVKAAAKTAIEGLEGPPAPPAPRFPDFRIRERAGGASQFAVKQRCAVQ